MKKIFAILCTLTLVLSLCACGGTAPAEEAPADLPADASADSFSIGICQLVQHPALDAATEGFQAALKEKLGDRVSFSVQNASGDSATCSVICNTFVSDEVDLIMANATPALLAAASSTSEIPILGTSVTDYGSALGIDNWTGTTGTNISGTSDLAPLDGQAAMLKELFPDAKNIGLLYCSGEPNSKYQIDIISEIFIDLGLNVTEYTFADSNDVASVTSNACSENDVIYIPTDNTAASCAESINNIALNAHVPIINGEANACAGCGVAALTISYFDLGYATGLMAVDILENGADVSQMEIQFAPKYEKQFNADNCEILGISVPDDYTAIEVE